MPMNRDLYPKDWERISHAVKSAAGWICTKCGKPCRRPGESIADFSDRLPHSWKSKVEGKWQRFTLTTAHLDHNPSNCDRANLRALCAPCHLAYDAEHHAHSRQIRKQTVKTSSKITRPAARWYGGKWILGKWIVDYLPPHTTYVEPFSGMWSVGLRKQPCSVEIYNDLHPGAVNFWLQLRDNPKDLIPLIESTYFDKPLSEWASEPGGTPLEQALNFYAVCLLSYTGGGTKWPGTSTVRLQRSEVQEHSHLWAIAERIKNVQIFNSDAFDIIKMFDGPDTLFYCDPCYLPDTRTCPKRYVYDMSPAQHRQLAELLNQVQGTVVLSGYPSPTYQQYYSGWQQEVKKTASNTSHKTALECLWIKQMPTTQTAVTLFSGFGLADVGLEQAGFKVVGAVEKSANIAEWHQINHPSGKTMVGSVEEFDYRQFCGVDLVHLSPPCQQYSIARSRNLARHQGSDAALLAFKAIEQISPKFITLENVRGYLKADSYSRFRQFLWDKGYWLNEQIIDCADYGIPQHRTRFILRGIRSDILPDIPISFQFETLLGEKYWDGLWLQRQPTKTGWYSAIADLLPTLPETKLAPWQIRRLPPEIRSHLLIGDQNQMTRTGNSPAFTVCTKGPPRALLFRRDGQRLGGSLDIFPPTKPSPTIRALGHDGHSRQLDGWNGQSVVKITPRALARFQTVPDTFKLPESATLACIGIGNGVPCEMMRQIAASFTTRDFTNSSKKMPTTTDTEKNSSNVLPSNDLITVSNSQISLLEAENQVSHQTVTDTHYLNGEEDLIGLNGPEIPPHPNEILIGPENSLADIENQKSRLAAQAQSLEDLIANYRDQVNGYHNLIKELEEKARAKVLEELQGLTVQMQTMLQKADSYGVKEKAREILNSALPSRSNSSSNEPDPPDRHPITSEESLSAQDSDKSDRDEHLTMQELEELQESPEERSAPKTEAPKWTSDDWRTPNEEKQPIVTLVERALGGTIGLDPTADDRHLIPAQQHFTQADDCLVQDWTSEAGTVFMNPPYSNPLPFLEKLIGQIDKGHVREAIVLLPTRCANNEKTGDIIGQRATAICIWKGRIAFIGEDDTPKNKTNFGCCLIYFGSLPASLFIETFRGYGNVSLPQNFAEPESELEVNPELPFDNWRRSRDIPPHEGQHLCDYKTFQVTYLVDLGDPPGIWKLSIIDKENSLVWYVNTQEFLEGKSPGMEWYAIQAKAHIDHLIAKSEAEAQAHEAEAQAHKEVQAREELKKLQKSLPLFQSLPTQEGSQQSQQVESPSSGQGAPPVQQPQLTFKFEFSSIAQVHSWENWFRQMIGKILNKDVKISRTPKQKWFQLENLTEEELVILQNLELPKDPPRPTEARRMWGAAKSEALSQMSDEEVERAASEARQDIYGQDAPTEHDF